MGIELLEDHYEEDQETQEVEKAFGVEEGGMYEFSEEQEEEQLYAINDSKKEFRDFREEQNFETPLDQGLMYADHYDPEGNFENEGTLT